MVSAHYFRDSPLFLRAKHSLGKSNTATHDIQLYLGTGSATRALTILANVGGLVGSADLLSQVINSYANIALQCGIGGYKNVYATKPTQGVSWFQEHAELSLDLIQRTGISKDASIIDIGWCATVTVRGGCSDVSKNWLRFSL